MLVSVVVVVMRVALSHEGQGRKPELQSLARQAHCVGGRYVDHPVNEMLE